ncbi:heparinase II/III family protein [Roseomonas haemaphysalidis]
MLRADAARRLGPRVLVRYGGHRLLMAGGVPARRLRGAERRYREAEEGQGKEFPRTPFFCLSDSMSRPGEICAASAAGCATPPQPGPQNGHRKEGDSGEFLPPTFPPARPMPSGWTNALRARLATLPPAGHHGPFSATAPALGMDLFTPGDVRPVWESGRLACLPALAQAARLWPGEGHAAALDARLAAWCAANPPFLGPHWACGQEAALRAMHLALALALLDRPPAPGARALLALHARRIRATALYAQAQDNNHAVSEPAGLYVIALLLGEDARPAGRALAAAVERLVAPDGGFAQVSTGYHRLLLDVLSLVEWLRRRHGAPPLPPPFAERAAAAARWLGRLVAADGAMPRLGHQDGSAFADLSLGGAADARGSAERAMRLFAGASAGFAEEPGCDWLGLPAPPPLPRPARWRAGGSMGWEAAGARGLLRCGPLRFRPGQADLLHFELWDGGRPLLADAGTGAYNPPPADRWWLEHFSAARAHNTITFDEREPMPRAGRFLLARWPRLRALPDGAAMRDANGHRHSRRVAVAGREWQVADAVGGHFSALSLRWHLGPGDWRVTPDGAAGPARIVMEADAPLSITLEPGWHSPAYGVAHPCEVLVARARAPVRNLLTRVGLP